MQHRLPADMNKTYRCTYLLFVFFLSVLPGDCAFSTRIAGSGCIAVNTVPKNYIKQHANESHQMYNWYTFTRVLERRARQTCALPGLRPALRSTH